MNDEISWESGFAAGFEEEMVSWLKYWINTIW